MGTLAREHPHSTALGNYDLECMVPLNIMIITGSDNSQSQFPTVSLIFHILHVYMSNNHIHVQDPGKLIRSTGCVI